MYRLTRSRTQRTLDHDILRTGPELAEPRSVPESAQRERHNGDEFQKSIILTPTTTRAGTTSKLSNNHADTRTEGGLRSPAMYVVLTPCGRQTPVQIMLRVPAASTRPTASPPAQNVHHSSAKCHRSATTAKRLPCSRDNWLPHALPLPLPAAQRVERPCSSSWPGRA